jgi:hypothetical protein
MASNSSRLWQQWRRTGTPYSFATEAERRIGSGVQFSIRSGASIPRISEPCAPSKSRM